MSTQRTLSPSLTLASRLGKTRSCLSSLTSSARSASVDGERRHADLLGLLAGELDLQGLGGDDLEREATTVDRGATAGRQVGAAVERADLAQRTFDVGRGHPVAALLAVDGQLDLAAEAHRDAGAVGDGLVDVGLDQVVRRELDALGLEDVADGVTGGAHLALLAVDRQGHGGGHRPVAERRAADGEDDHGNGGDEGDLAARGPAEQGGGAGLQRRLSRIFGSRSGRSGSGSRQKGTILRTSYSPGLRLPACSPHGGGAPSYLTRTTAVPMLARWSYPIPAICHLPEQEQAPECKPATAILRSGRDPTHPNARPQRHTHSIALAAG